MIFGVGLHLVLIHKKDGGNEGMTEFRTLFDISLNAHSAYVSRRIENKKDREIFLSTIKIVEQTSFYLENDTYFGWWLNNVVAINQNEPDCYTLFSSPTKYRSLGYEIALEVLKTVQKRLYGSHYHRKET